MRRAKKVGIWGAFLLLLAASSASTASYITMVTDFSVTQKKEGTVLTVRSQNRGDEPAYGIQVEVQVANKEIVGPLVPQLGVNASTSTEFSLNVPFRLPGHYPILVKTRYRDANNYPFTAPAVGFLDFQSPVVSKILIRAVDANIPATGKGTMAFTVRNNDSVRRELDLTLLLPDELIVANNKQRLAVAASEAKSVQFVVENFSALQNSGYAVTLVAEHEDGKNHYSTAGSGKIRITAPEVFSGYLLWVVLAGGALALALAAVFFARSRRKKT